MVNRFQDIIAEECGFPTTQKLKRYKHEWNELEEAIYKIDQNYEYGYGSSWGISIDDIISVQSMIDCSGYVPNTLIVHPELAQDLANWHGIILSGINE